MNENPLTWWKTNGVAIFPLMQKPAMQYMQIPATCMSMELITTSKGVTFNERRNILPPNYVKEIVYIHKNSWILDSQ